MNSNYNIVGSMDDLINLDITLENSIVRTLGYYSSGDGGGAEYLIKSSDNYDNSIIAKSEYINSSKLEKSTYMFFGNYKKIVECEV